MSYTGLAFLAFMVAGVKLQALSELLTPVNLEKTLDAAKVSVFPRLYKSFKKFQSDFKKTLAPIESD